VAKFLREQRHRAFGQGGLTGTGMAGKQNQSGLWHGERFQMFIKFGKYVFQMRKKLYDATGCFLLKLVKREQHGRDSCVRLVVGG